jgi:hypothetical protein
MQPLHCLCADKLVERASRHWSTHSAMKNVTEAKCLIVLSRFTSTPDRFKDYQLQICNRLETPHYTVRNVKPCLYYDLENHERPPGPCILELGIPAIAYAHISAHYASNHEDLLHSPLLLQSICNKKLRVELASSDLLQIRTQQTNFMI